MEGEQARAEQARKDMIRFMQVQDENLERKRAMLLSWVDEIERLRGYGDEGKPPRTSQIRKFWRESGEPVLPD